MKPVLLVQGTFGAMRVKFRPQSRIMPTKIRAFCGFGKHRRIEVENEVTAYAEYANGATAVFITSTCEAPGTNRFEVAGDRGKIVIEGGKLTFWRLRVSETEFNATFKGSFGEPECWKCDIPFEPGEGEQHIGITRDWVQAIRRGTPLLAPGVDGIHGLTLSNAMLLSAWTTARLNFRSMRTCSMTCCKSGFVPSEGGRA